MKNIILTIILIFYEISFGQVGINTNQPTAMLDINGNLRIRSTPVSNSIDTVKDSVLVVNKVGEIHRITSRQLVNSYLKTFVKGKFSTVSGSLLELTLLSNRIKIPFDTEDFDFNNEFNAATNVFTAKQDGIYAVNLQIKLDSGIGISTNVGVEIQKNSEVISRCTFANVGILGINATPPIRALNTIIELRKDETISFYIVSNLLNVNVLGNSADSFFSIHQVR